MGPEEAWFQEEDESGNRTEDEEKWSQQLSYRTHQKTPYKRR